MRTGGHGAVERGGDGLLHRRLPKLRAVGRHVDRALVRDHLGRPRPAQRLRGVVVRVVVVVVGGGGGGGGV